MGKLFDADYNIQRLKKIKVNQYGFEFYVTPRLIPHYTSQPYEATTAFIVREKAKFAGMFIDVGAHYGFFSVLAGRENPACGILAFEPIPENFEILQKNMKLNGISNAHLFKKAVSDTEGIFSFQVSAASDNSGFIANPAAPVLKNINVEVIRLDQFIDLIPDKPTLVKIDTEGSEVQVLQGMKKIIRQMDNLELIIEFNQRCLRHHGVDPEELLQQIAHLGFSISFIHEEDGEYEQYDGRRPWMEYMKGMNYKNLYCVKSSTMGQKGRDDCLPLSRLKKELIVSPIGETKNKCTNTTAWKKEKPTIQKILLVNHNLSPHEVSGTPLSTLNHALGMQRRGLEVAVLIPSTKVKAGFRKEHSNGFAVYQISSIDKYNAYLAVPNDERYSEYRNTIGRIIDDFSPQVVHINDYVYMPAEIIEIFSRRECIVVRNVCNCEELCHRDYPVIANGLQGRLCSGPDNPRKCSDCFVKRQVLGPNERIRKDAPQIIEEKIRRRFEYIKSLYQSAVDKVIFTSDAFRSYFTHFVPIPNDKTIVVPRGFLFDFERSISRPERRSGTIRFAFISNVMFSKGIDITLKAFEALCDTYDFVLHIYGATVDQEYVPYLKKLEELYPDRFHYHGQFNNNDLPQISRDIDVCIVPSYFDTYNRVLREVLYLGIPVIVTDFFGAFIVEDGKNGLRIPVGDAGALAAKMAELMSNPSMIDNLSRGATQTHIPTLGEEVDQLVEIYNDLYARSVEKGKGQPLEIQPTPQKQTAPDERAVRPIAFYLPQFHPILENNAWWGKGFTEWTNVAKAKPLFPGHYQPHLPGELGFYDLRLPEVRQAQADLAREYGIYGFCYYHYWFNGKLLLERPLQEVLKSGKPDFPFCVCWANENWTRTWDGGENHILMKQIYGEEDDRNHIRYLCKIFEDKRYIRINGKPLFLVYRANRFPDPLRTTTLWREESRGLGIGELYLCRVESFPDERTDPLRSGFDAAVEFQPDWNLLSSDLRDERYPDLAAFKYEKVVDRMLMKEAPYYRRFPCVTPSWDNTARRKRTSVIFTDSSPDQYGRWLRGVVKKLADTSDEAKFIFINAWNEWGEGNHLEPDQQFDRAYLEATKRVLDEVHRNRHWALPTQAHERILKMLISAGKHTEAIFALERLIESFPDYAPAHNDLGVLYGAQGKIEKTAAAYERAVSLDPTNLTFLKNLADFYTVEGHRIDEAFEIYQRILTHKPDDFETLLSLGHIAIQRERFDVAQKLFMRVQEVEPGNAQVRDTLKALSDIEHNIS